MEGWGVRLGAFFQGQWGGTPVGNSFEISRLLSRHAVYNNKCSDEIRFLPFLMNLDLFGHDGT